jgi:hypothetical protein
MSPKSAKNALHELEPDPLEPNADEVERYVAALQDVARTDVELARRRAWSQIRLAGARAGARRAEAHDTLGRIFRLGGPPEPALDGPLRGILVTPTTAALADPLFRAITSAWLPWGGKRFDAESQTGDNLLARSARIPAKAIWPRYRLEESGDGQLVGFRFRTYVEPAKLDDGLEALKIDYDSEENPGLLIRDILDELVQVVPGAYLGKMLLRRGGGWRLMAYFALQPPETVRVEEPVAEAVAAEPVPAPA